MKRIFAALAVALLAAPASAATVSITAAESGGNVVLTGSGSIDLSGGSHSFTFNAASFNTNNHQFFLGANGFTDVYTWGSSSGGTLSNSRFDFTVAGDTFGFDRMGALGLNQGYSSGQAINFVWTVANRTLADLGLNFGTVATIGNNSISLSRAPISDVPLPASAFLLLAGMGGLTVVSRRKTAKA